MERRKSLKRWNPLLKASEIGNMKAQAGVGTRIDAFVFYAFLDILNKIWIKLFSDLPLPTN
jgi:hypothetical protein